MKTHAQHFSFQQKLLVMALLAAFGPAHADEDELAKLIKPDTAEISVGAATLSAGRLRPRPGLGARAPGTLNRQHSNKR